MEKRAAQILREEVRKRTGLDLKQVDRLTDAGASVIVLGVNHRHQPARRTPGARERSLGAIGAQRTRSHRRTGFKTGGGDLRIRHPRSAFWGRAFLAQSRAFPWKGPGASDLRIVTAPKYEIRAHQLGYRPKVNAYDAWSEQQFDPYIRELALFGTNAIEIMPPRTDDELTSPLMKVPPIDMMVKVANITHACGLDVWLWYANVGKDYTSEAGRRAEPAEPEDVFPPDPAPRRGLRHGRRSGRPSSGCVLPLSG